MENIKTPQYRSVHWRCGKPFEIYVGMYAKWDSDEIHRKESWRESDWPGESFLRNNYLVDNFISPSC